MAADTRPFKSKEQDGQGNEVIIRDQQLVEQTSQTTMASGEYFEIVDVDGRMAKIPKANMMSVVLEAIRLLLDDSGSNISAANLTKILGLSASSIGNVLPADLASVLGEQYKYSVVSFERGSSDVPSGYAEGFGLNVTRYESGVAFQIALFQGGTGGNSQKLFTRTSWNATPHWSQWYALY